MPPPAQCHQGRMLPLPLSRRHWLEWIEKAIDCDAITQVDWMSLYVVEITVYSMHSCAMSQCSDLRI